MALIPPVLGVFDIYADLLALFGGTRDAHDACWVRHPRALFASGAGLRAESWDAAIRGPVGSVRRIGFVQLTPSRRHDPRGSRRRCDYGRAPRRTALVVDVTDSALAARLERVTAPSELRAYACTSADATAGLASARTASGVLRPARSTTDATGARLAEASPISRFFDVAITDFGPRHPAADMPPPRRFAMSCARLVVDRGPAELSRSSRARSPNCRRVRASCSP